MDKDNKKPSKRKQTAKVLDEIFQTDRPRPLYSEEVKFINDDI